MITSYRKLGLALLLYLYIFSLAVDFLIVTFGYSYMDMIAWMPELEESLTAEMRFWCRKGFLLFALGVWWTIGIGCIGMIARKTWGSKFALIGFYSGFGVSFFLILLIIVSEIMDIRVGYGLWTVVWTDLYLYLSAIFIFFLNVYFKKKLLRFRLELPNK